MAPITVQLHFTDTYALDADVIIMKKITNLAYFKDELAKYDHLQKLLYAGPTINDDGDIYCWEWLNFLKLLKMA